MLVYFVRVEYSGWALDSAPIAVSGAALDYSADGSLDVGSENGDNDIVELLDLAFFDDDATVLLVRAEGAHYFRDLSILFLHPLGGIV